MRIHFSTFPKPFTQTKIIAIDDPAAFSNTKNPSDANSGGIGSGGATLNAIHVVTECLSAMAGQTVVDAAHLKKVCDCFYNLILI